MPFNCIRRQRNVCQMVVPSSSVGEREDRNVRCAEGTCSKSSVSDEDTSFAKIIVGGLEEIDIKSEHKVLGMNWDCEKNTFCFK